MASSRESAATVNGRVGFSCSQPRNASECFSTASAKRAGDRGVSAPAAHSCQKRSRDWNPTTGRPRRSANQTWVAGEVSSHCARSEPSYTRTSCHSPRRRFSFSHSVLSVLPRHGCGVTNTNVFRCRSSSSGDLRRASKSRLALLAGRWSQLSSHRDAPSGTQAVEAAASTRPSQPFRSAWSWPGKSTRLTLLAVE